MALYTLTKTAFFFGHGSVFEHPPFGDIPHPLSCHETSSIEFVLSPLAFLPPSSFRFENDFLHFLSSSPLVYNGSSASAPNDTKHTPKQFKHQTKASPFGSTLLTISCPRLCAFSQIFSLEWTPIHCGLPHLPGIYIFVLWPQTIPYDVV